jgi:cyclopropane-fatty-acyl-phospholipid synthase
MTAAIRRLQSLTTLLAHLRERLGVDIGFVLWDGTTVPSDLAPNALALAIADEGAVAALIRRPKLDTLFNLLISARLELRNGTLFDLMTLRPRVRSKDFRKALDKTLALGTAARFLFVPRGGPWPLEEVHGDKAGRDGSETTNKANIQYHYDLSNAFSIPRWSIAARISPSRTTTSRGRSATSST